MKKKVMYYGIGVGPLRYSFTRALTRLTMRFVDAVSVRDVASFDLLRSLGVRTPVHLASDPALSLSSVPVAETKILLKKMGVNVNKPYVVFCLRHWFDTYSLLPVSFVNGFNIQTAGNKRLQNNFASELARVVSYYQSQNCQVVFIPFWISRDNKVHDSVVDKLPSRKGVFVCRFELSPSQAIGVISSAEQLVGMRLHSLIFAAVAATPFVAIDYSPKVKNFLELLLGRYGVSRIAIKPEGLQSDELIGKIKRLPKELPVVTINKILELKARESKSLDVLKMVSL
jgi:polysaccharide pyruvyl transferase WcaK-like protein